MNKKKILLIIGDAPYPINTGGRSRTWNFIKTLVKENELSILSMIHQPMSAADIEETKKYAQNLWTVSFRSKGKSKSGGISKRLKNIFTTIPWEISRSFQPDLDHKLEEILRENKFDVVLMRYVYQGQYVFRHIKKLSGCRVILDIDDIESRKAAREMDISRFKNRYDEWRKKLNNFLLELYHKRNLRQLDRCVVCSKDDAEYVKSKGWNKNVVIVPNAIDMEKFKVNRNGSVEKMIFFCGAMDYEPNIDAAIWFAKSIFPKILQKDPAVKLEIVGRQPGPEILELANQSVLVHANVPSMNVYYERAGVVIVPIRVAGGTRIKILEAAACRCPVVSTTIGAEGLAVVNEKHCLLVDDEQQFADACLRVLNDQNLAQRLADEIYSLVKNTYDVDVVQKSIKELVA